MAKAIDAIGGAVNGLSQNQDALVKAAYMSDAHILVLQRLVTDIDRDTLLRSADGLIDRRQYYTDYHTVAQAKGQVHWANGASVEEAVRMGKLESAKPEEQAPEEQVSDAPEPQAPEGMREEVFGGDYGENNNGSKTNDRAQTERGSVSVQRDGGPQGREYAQDHQSSEPSNGVPYNTT